MSSLSESGMELPFIATDAKGESLHLSARLTREAFEEKCQALLDRCRSPLTRALEDAKMSPDDIGQTVMVGGSTRMPAVYRLVEGAMGRPPVQSVNPDEAVALGAALQAGVVTGRVKNVVLLDVVPMSLGIVVEGVALPKMAEHPWPSGRRHRTHNPPLKIRWFESVLRLAKQDASDSSYFRFPPVLKSRRICGHDPFG